MASITVVIPALNEEKRLRQCLDSVKWANEIIVLDAGSTDKTADIASEYADIVVRSENMLCATGMWIGCDMATSDWILTIGADFIVSDKLALEILDTIKFTKLNGFRIPIIESFYQGKVNHLVGKRLSLVRKNAAKFPKVTHHFGSYWSVWGEVGELEGRMRHYRNMTIANMCTKLNKYSSDIAEERFNDREKPDMVKLLVQLVFKNFDYIFRKKYYKMGMFGLYILINNSFSKILEEFKLWEKYL